MSRVTEKAFDHVNESEFIFGENGAHTIEVRNALIFWTNFAGKPNKFGNAARNFNLAVTEEVANALREKGWRVRETSVYKENENDEGQKLYFVNVKVNMGTAYPPLVTLFTQFKGKRSRRSLTADTLSELDSIDIQSADCIINEYSSRNYPDKVTGYLKKLNVIQEPDLEFGGKYDDWLDEDSEEVPDEDYNIPRTYAE